MNDSYPVLYILMRNDLDSLNPGKACAQAAHAANMFTADFERRMQEVNAAGNVKTSDNELNTAFYNWANQTAQSFGTTIVLGNTMERIRFDIKSIREKGYLAGVVHDPTYPLKDGSIMHLIPLDTCAYVFASDKNDFTLRTILSDYNLY